MYIYDPGPGGGAPPMVGPGKMKSGILNILLVLHMILKKRSCGCRGNNISNHTLGGGGGGPPDEPAGPPPVECWKSLYFQWKTTDSEGPPRQRGRSPPFPKPHLRYGIVKNVVLPAATAMICSRLVIRIKAREARHERAASEASGERDRVGYIERILQQNCCSLCSHGNVFQKYV